jgi:hypothetical protein
MVTHIRRVCVVHTMTCKWNYLCNLFFFIYNFIFIFEILFIVFASRKILEVAQREDER